MGIHKQLRDTLDEVFNRYKQEPSPDVEVCELTSALKRSMDSCRKHSKSFKLYRYSPADFYNIRNFEKGQLFLSPIGKMNDVYDGVPDSNIDELTNEEQKQFEGSAYLKCFSQSKDNLLMWAHYAEQHHGFCVEYDLALLERDCKLFDYIFPVVYTPEDRPKHIDIKYLANLLLELSLDIPQSEFTTDIWPMLLTKSVDWRYEKEWRLIIPKQKMYGLSLSQSGIPVLQDKMVDFDCATAIYLGRRISAEVKESISEIADRINTKRSEENRQQIKIYQAKLHDAEYRLIFEEVLQCKTI
jgi:hypothetical protein